MELIAYSKFLLALALVVALILLSAWAMRKFGLIPGYHAPKKGNGRLKLVESLPLDIHRKLVIVKCDNIEHLLVLGQNSETVIESPMSTASTAAKNTQDGNGTA